MPFNTLLLTCLSPKKSFFEAGGHIHFNQKADEIILLFVIDPESNSTSTAYQDLIIKGPICDLILYYIKDHNKVICFIELKGANIQKAVEQIENTFKNFKTLLEHSTGDKACCPHCRDISYKSYIQLHGSAPRPITEYERALAKQFGRRNFRVSQDQDVDSFIRE